MAKFKLGPTLFQIPIDGKGKEVIISEKPIKTGERIPVGVAPVSKHRTSAAMGAQITINPAVFAAEETILGKMKFLISENYGWVYSEYENSASGRTIPLVFDGNSITSTEDLLSSKNAFSQTAIAGLILAYTTSFASKSDGHYNEEAHDTFEKAVNDFSKEGIVENDDLYLLSDSVYYGYIKSVDSLNFSVDENIHYSVQQAIETGVFDYYFVEGKTPFKFVNTDSISRSGESENDETLSSTSLNAIAKRMRDGEWILPFTWDEEVIEFIPDISIAGDYCFTETFVDIATFARDSLLEALEMMELGQTNEAILKYNVINNLLTGVPGTGKSVLIRTLAAVLGMPLYVLPLSEGTEKEHLTGLIQVGDDSKLEKVKTLLLLWAKHGGVIGMEEVNLASANLLQGVFSQLLEAPYFIDAFDKDRIVRHPLAIYFAAMNTGLIGTSPLNQGYTSRFTGFYKLKRVTLSEFINFGKTRYGDRYSDAMLRWAFDVYEKTLNYLLENDGDNSEIAPAVSMRCCFNILRQYTSLKNTKKAIKYAVSGIFDVYDTYNESLADGLTAYLDSVIGAI